MYQALYRVYRPQSFSDMVGQDLVAKTLRNAIIMNKVSHAYLFSGPRGTGKTSVAKIFAKAINCLNPQEGQPCNECEICRAITKGALADVIEIDAASNNGVEEIRDIRDKSRYAPTSAKYKVYIIDEVHMLSTGAFNALLKTLEEPSDNVIFILATTEPHKIPATILSRVQHFEFKKISLTAIKERMATILSQEGIGFDQQALDLIARSANGGMRDALSLLDQAISYADDSVSYQDALEVTGSASQEQLEAYVRALVAGQTRQALDLLQSVLDQGKDLNRFIEELLLYMRDLLVAKVSQEEGPDFIENLSVGQLYRYIDRLSQTQQQVKTTLQQDIYMEVMTIQLANAASDDKPSATQPGTSPAASADLLRLQEEVRALKEQVIRLQEGGVSSSSSTSSVDKNALMASKIAKAFKPNLSKVFGVLAQATREDKDRLTAEWEDILSCLSVSQRAKLNASTVLAASPTGVVIGFEYDILCVMTDEDKQLKENISQHGQRLIQHPCQIECVPINQWKEIRQQFIQAKKSGSLSQFLADKKTAVVNNDAEILADEKPEQEENISVTKASELFGGVVEIMED